MTATLTPSNFSIAHKVTLGADLERSFHSTVGVFYNGYSGGPYSYMIDGDANADGVGFNDIDVRTEELCGHHAGRSRGSGPSSTA